MKYKYILFDLDGTVSESAAGIRASLEHAVTQLGAPMPDLDDYTKYIGPPLLDTFLNLVGLNQEDAQCGSALYREYYNEKGIFLNRAYDGIAEAVRTLREQGARLAVCTSKYEPFAERIIGIIGLDGCFDAVCGSNLDGSRKDKKDLIPYAVASLGGDFAADRARTVMLGDTWFDAKGARLCGVDFIGVEYGYGDRQAMAEQGAIAFAKTPKELTDILSAQSAKL